VAIKQIAIFMLTRTLFCEDLSPSISGATTQEFLWQTGLMLFGINPICGKSIFQNASRLFGSSRTFW